MKADMRSSDSRCCLGNRNVTRIFGDKELTRLHALAVKATDTAHLRYYNSKYLASHPDIISTMARSHRTKLDGPISKLQLDFLDTSSKKRNWTTMSDSLPEHIVVPETLQSRKIRKLAPRTDSERTEWLHEQSISMSTTPKKPIPVEPDKLCDGLRILTLAPEAKTVLQNSSKGEDLVQILMDYVIDPPFLYQLASTCSLAKNMFETWPVHYLNVSLSGVPPQLRQLAIAYIAVADNAPKDNDTTVPHRSFPDMQAPSRMSPGELKSFWCTSRQSEVTKFLDRYMGDGRPPVPADLVNPFRTLVKLSAVFEAVQSLAKAPLWTEMDSNENAQDRFERVSRGLWQFQIFCTLFRRDIAAKSSGGTPDAVEDELTVLKWETCGDQRRFFHKLGSSETLREIRIYDDLSRIVQQAHAPLIALLFETNYRPNNRSSRWSKDSEIHLVRTVEVQFMGFVEYEMSLGLKHLSEKYLNNIDPTRTATGSLDLAGASRIGTYTVPYKEHWTNLFFNEAVTKHECPDFEWTQNFPGRLAYKLQPASCNVQEASHGCSDNSKSLVISKEDARLGWILEISFGVVSPTISLGRRIKIETPILLDYVSVAHPGLIPLAPLCRTWRDHDLLAF